MKRQVAAAVFGGLALGVLACSAWAGSAVGVGPAAPMAAPAVAAAALAAEKADLDKVVGMAQRGETDGLLDLARIVVTSPSFGALSSADQCAALTLFGAALIDAGDIPAAHTVMVRATAMEEATAQAWLFRLFSTSGRDKPELLLDITTLARRWPDALKQVKASYIVNVVAATSDDRDLADSRFAAMEALKTAGWPADPDDQVLVDQDYVWIALIDSELERGHTAQAAAVAASVTTPSELVKLRIDKRYDPLKSALADRADIGHAQVAYLSTLKAYVAVHPDRLDALNQLAEELILQGQADAALALTDSALARMKTGPAYPDADQEFRWTLDHRTDALMMLGQTDEAMSNLIHAAAQPEGGAANVSQTINLGDWYNALGRPADALRAVVGVTDHMSPYGLMQVQEVRACAYAQQNDVVDYQAQLALMRGHLSDAPDAVERALLCADGEDAAAELLIARLNDRSQRLGALLEVQTYLRPAHEPAFAAETRRRLEAVRGRPAVAAAIAAVGRVEAQPRLAPVD